MSLLQLRMLKSFMVVVLLALVLMLTKSELAFGGVYVGPIPNTDFKHGRVMARSIVMNPDTDEPYLVEFDLEGNEVGEVDIKGASVLDVNILQAADYFFYETQLESFKEANKETLAKGAELLGRNEYEQREFRLADNKTVISKSDLPEGINSVLVRGQSNRLVNNSEQLVLLEFPFDMTQNFILLSNEKSLIVNKKGQIITSSSNRIGYRTGFFGDPTEPQNSRGYRVGPDDKVFGPIEGVKVNVDEFVYRAGVDATDEEGKYSFRFYMPFCPPGGFSFTTDVWAQLRYQNFLPRGSASIPYHLRTPGYSYCFAQLVPAAIAPTISAIQSTAAVPFIQSNLYADIMFVTGNIVLENSNGEYVELGDTTYTAFEAPAEDVTQDYYDFNGDGEYDTVVKGKVLQCKNIETDEEKEIFVNADGTPAADPLPGYQCTAANPEDDQVFQGIFFDGQQDDAEDFPDIVRLIDQELRDEPIGLLKGISTDDLRNTDVYFFRESTGQLILERRGLKQSEAEYRPEVLYDEEDNEVAYRIMLRGPSDTSLNIGGGIRRSASYEDWATSYQLTEPLRKRESDHPRAGEYIKIVAINRATGYTGTVRVQLETSGGGGLEVEAPVIVLTPPNLKVWAERTYDVEAGLTKGDERKYLIGAEGGALTSDKTITIFTEWLDQDGKPFPDQLGLDNGEQFGLTGRLARVAGSNRIVSAGQAGISEFSIAPGRNTQVLRVNTGDSAQGDHFYVHVIGKARDQDCVNGSSCPDFDVRGDDAPYDSRPKLLTPFLVPLYDEDTSWQEYSVYRELLKAADEEENTDGAIVPDKPQPAHVWQYRPEYQFTQFDLDIQEINRTLAGTSGAPGEPTNIIDADKPVIGSSDDLLEVLYSLISSEFERLTPIDGKQDLILALGQSEQKITFGEDQTIRFDNLDSIGALDSEDFISLRLYTNNDAGNILWEYAFEYLNYYALLDDDIIPNDDGAIEISADEPEIGLVANLIGFANRDEEKKYNVSIRWLLDGDGELEKTNDSDADVAIFRNTVTLSRKSGETTKVSAQIVDTTSGENQEVPLIFEVVPGVPFSIEATAEGELSIDGAGETVISGIARDEWGNPVEDGTSVTPITSASVKIKEQPESTVDGEFTFIVEGTDFAELASIGIRIGNKEEVLPLEIAPVEISFDGIPAELGVNSRHVFTIKAMANGKPLANYTLDTWVTNARLDKGSVVTGSDGTAQLILLTPPEPRNIEVKAMAGLQVPTVFPVRITRPDGEEPSINNTNANMIGDSDTAEAFTFDRWDTESFTVVKEVQGSLELFGTPGETIPLSLGDIYEPNNLIQAAFWMNSTEGADFKDEVGFSSGSLENVITVQDSRMLADNSFKFIQGRDDGGNITRPSRAKVKSAERFQIAKNVSFRIDVKADRLGGELVNLGNGLVLSLATSGELQLNAQTADGDYFVELPNFPLGQWKKVAVSYQNDTLTLALDNERATVAATGDLLYSPILVEQYDAEGNFLSSGDYGMVVGQEFDGNLDCLKWFNLFTRPLVAFENGTSQMDVLIGPDGSAEVLVNSLGRLNSFGSNLSMQTVAAATPMDSQPIRLVSASMFEALAQATVSAGLIEGLPEYSQAYLNDVSTSELDVVGLGFSNPMYQVGLFENAYAYELGWRQIFSVVSMLIGLDSLQVIWEQVGNLLMGREVDLVSLSIAILDVLALFPPAAPLKAVTIPAKLAIKLLRVGNTKAVKYLGGVLKKMFQKAKGRDFSLVFQGIAFVIIIADMAKDEEGREAIKTLASIINSTDDFIDILGFFSLADDEIKPSETASNDTYGFGLFPDAYAKVPVGVGLKFGKVIKESAPVLRRAGALGPKGMGAYAREVRSLAAKATNAAEKRFAQRLSAAAFTKGTFRGILGAANKAGARSIRDIARCKFGGQRASPLLLLGVIGYLESELFVKEEGEPTTEPQENGTLFASLNDDERTKQIIELQKIIVGAIPSFCSGTKKNTKKPKSESQLNSQAHGKAFQLIQLAILHLASKTTGEKVIGLEVERDVFLFTDDIPLGAQQYNKALAYGRDVDILVQGPKGENWHEQKSWKGKGTGKNIELSPKVTPWDWRSGARKQRKNADFDDYDKKNKGSAGHRQFVLDHVAVGMGATARNDDPDNGQDLPIIVEDLAWQFQKFRTNKGDNKAENPSIDNIKEGFSQLPRKITKDLFEDHSGVGKMKVGNISVGSIDALFDIFGKEFKAALLEELKEEEIFLELAN